MNCLRKWCIIITEKRGFELFILSSILVNTVVLGSHHFMIEDDAVQIIQSINFFFVSVFTLEALMKIVAQKLDYFRDQWNLFDFIVLLATLVMLVPLSLGYGNDF